MQSWVKSAQSPKPIASGATGARNSCVIGRCMATSHAPNDTGTGNAHSIFTFAALMTSSHLAESLRRNSAKASSGPGTGCTAKRSIYRF